MTVHGVQLGICAVAAILAAWGLMSGAYKAGRALYRRLELASRAAWPWRLLGWRSNPCGCVWRSGRDPITSLRFYACQGYAPDAPAIRVQLASGTAHLGGTP